MQSDPNRSDAAQDYQRAAELARAVGGEQAARSAIRILLEGARARRARLLAQAQQTEPR